MTLITPVTKDGRPFSQQKSDKDFDQALKDVVSDLEKIPQFKFIVVTKTENDEIQT